MTREELIAALRNDCTVQELEIAAEAAAAMLEQEPVSCKYAGICNEEGTCTNGCEFKGAAPVAQPQLQCPQCLYIGTMTEDCTEHPVAHPLTDEQMLSLWAGDSPRPTLGKNKVLDFARAIERAHGIGGKV